MSEVRVIQINESVFAENDRAAERIRRQMTDQQLRCNSNNTVMTQQQDNNYGSAATCSYRTAVKRR